MHKYAPLGIVFFVLAVVVGACTFLAPTPDAPFVRRKLTSPPLAVTHAADLDAPATPARDPQRFGFHGRFRVVNGTACGGVSGNPLVWPHRLAAVPAGPRPPAAGAPLVIEWTVEGAAAPPTLLLLSFGDVTPVPLGATSGFAGCTLHVDPNPKKLLAFTPGKVPWLTQDGQRVRMELALLPDSFAGLEINMQLVAGSNGRWKLSPGLELWVGSGSLAPPSIAGTRGN